jgi:hypothetical protein
MAGKRKRHRPGPGSQGDAKRQKVATSLNGGSQDPVVKNAVLAQYYLRVLSLREYLLSKLPPTSKIRRKKIFTFGRKAGQETSGPDQSLANALDQILIGVSRDSQSSQEERWRQWASFSHRAADTSASTLANLSGIGLFSQSEVCGYSVSLFRKHIVRFDVSNARNRLSTLPSGSCSPSRPVAGCSICYAKASGRTSILVQCTEMATSPRVSQVCFQFIPIAM